MIYFLFFGLFGHFAGSEICDLTDDLSGCYRKFQSFEAISQIHKFLDGDKNGEVDSREAARFVRDEFCSAGCSRNRRSLTTDDPLVSLSDLWSMWQTNPAFTWNVKDTVKWLTESVNLPRYEDTFVRHSVDGKSLPLLAMQNMSYLTDVLMINNPIDKKRLMLKALDTVLFGPPQRLPLISKNASLVTASCGILILLLFGISHWCYHNVVSVDKKIDFPDCSSTTERILKQLQIRLEDLERLRYSLNRCEEKADLGSTAPAALNSGQIPQSTGPDPWVSFSVEQFSPNNGRIIEESSDWERDSAKSRVSLVRGDSAWNVTEPDACAVLRQPSEVKLSPRPELMIWLQFTYELEMQQYRTKKLDAELQLNAARQACKRLNRKRYHILGSVRLLHTDSLDELEYRLIRAKHVLEQLQEELQERARRWSRIEALTGFQITSNPGLPQLRAQLAAVHPSTPLVLDNITSSSLTTVHDISSPTHLACDKGIEQTHKLCLPQTNGIAYANATDNIR
ncbi:unnamed protein product [Dicrocoelium dendriticum]|nr:unnamed protein product [Dicrocoelium dendriticum]